MPLRWVGRAVGVALCATARMIAAGLASLGGDWFSDTFTVHSIDDLIGHLIVAWDGEAIAATVFLSGHRSVAGFLAQ